MGLQLAKLHRGIQFKQKPFLKSYIDFNSTKRACATNSFEKDFYKLKNNALFGKTMEDVRKRMNYKLVTDPLKYLKLVASPLFIDRDRIDDEITGVKLFKNKVELCKPI